MGRKKLVITIGRQYGSGGNEIGRKIAKELGLNFYDKNILRIDSDHSKVEESCFVQSDEKAGGRLLYRVVSGLAPELREPVRGAGIATADNLFRFQSEVIQKLTAEESCVIVGRCAGYLLEGRDDLELLRLFIFADLSSRIGRIMKREYLEEKEAFKQIRRIDRERRSYYRYYTGREWGNPENYDMLLNAFTMGIESCVRTVEDYLKREGYGI